MYEYTVSQWILFFFWYCFVGWIWECFYVFVRKGIENKKWKWINRGFLNGPIIPIYGFASLAILIGTIAVRDTLWLVYIMGALAATAMELVTGSTMERLFHVKYWDYSDMPWNYKGHICFFVSLFWGFLSVILVDIIHVPVERLILQWSGTATELVAFVLVGIFAYDFNGSLRAALDVKELLEKLTESRLNMERLEKRVDAVIAFTPIPDLTDIKELSGNTKEKIAGRLEQVRNRRIERLEYLKERIVAGEYKDKEVLLEQLEKQKQALFQRSNKQFYRARIHLLHNPTARSGKYREALEELKTLLADKK